ncbi:unnamed protein product, partial [Ilex paraguariensis]
RISQLGFLSKTLQDQQSPKQFTSLFVGFSNAGDDPRLRDAIDFVPVESIVPYNLSCTRKTILAIYLPSVQYALLFPSMLQGEHEFM